MQKKNVLMFVFIFEIVFVKK